MGQLSMIGMFVYISMVDPTQAQPDLVMTFAYFVPSVSAICFGLSFVLPAKLVSAAADKATLSAKLRGFQTALIIRMALLEMPSLLGCVAFLLTGEYYWFAANLVSMLLFAMLFPTRDKVIDGLRLSGAEVEVLNDPKAIVMEYEYTNV